MGCLAARVGDERTAFEYFFSGIKSHPPFIPALERLLNLGVSRRLVEARRWELLHVARVEPQFAQNIFDYLLLHRAFDAAPHLLRTRSLNETIRSGLEERQAAALSSPKNRAKPGIDFVGPFFEHTSLARINREIAAALLDRDDLNTILEPSAPGCGTVTNVSRRKSTSGGLLRSFRAASFDGQASLASGFSASRNRQAGTDRTVGVWSCAASLGVPNRKQCQRTVGAISIRTRRFSARRSRFRTHPCNTEWNRYRTVFGGGNRLTPHWFAQICAPIRRWRNSAQKRRSAARSLQRNV